jgi:L-seryl-tRNA(Ser) seleniumtransferase
MGVDRFGNPHAPSLSYARGEILSSTEDDFQKLQRAWALIRERGGGKICVFTGLEHSLPLAAEELTFADDEIAPALCFERLRKLALEHLGGSPETDDVAVFNRLTGATIATHLTLVKPGDVVIGVSASHSHPSVVRAARHVGARFIDASGVATFRDATTTERSVALVVLTRLAVTYDLLPLEAIETVVRLAHDNGALVYVDDAGAGTADLLIKFVPPETLERFGGAKKYAEAINGSLTHLGELLRNPEDIRELLLGRQ